MGRFSVVLYRVIVRAANVAASFVLLWVCLVLCVCVFSGTNAGTVEGTVDAAASPDHHTSAENPRTTALVELFLDKPETEGGALQVGCGLSSLPC
jgi:hypothetical protein